MAIQSFRCTDTRKFFSGERMSRFVSIESVAMRKLAMLNVAAALTDLLIPPGNRLESLIGDRAGTYSIRINSRWRICFVWTIDGPEEVEIVDYH